MAGVGFWKDAFRRLLKSRMAVTGDRTQIDLPRGAPSGLFFSKTIRGAMDMTVACSSAGFGVGSAICSSGGATSGRLLRSRWIARVWRTELGFFGV